MYHLYATRQPGHAGGMLLLRRALQDAGLDPDTIPQRRPNGKPFLPGFFFNLSHSGRWAVCAVSDGEVGVDLEQERKLHREVERRFTLAERAFLQTLAGAPRQSAFFDLWVLKEAALKFTGDGLAAGLSSVEVTLRPVTISLPGVYAALLPPPEGGYHLALCGTSPIPQQPELTIL